ncbi:MAG: polysaccharide deacetylase family protein [Rhizobiales bacterium]|nr:polysaccharide deacetylase family protein [Hyphomicrobiales bacterium]
MPMVDAGNLVRRLMAKAARGSGLAPLVTAQVAGIGAILTLRRVGTRKPGGPGIGIAEREVVSPAFLDQALTELRRLGYRLVTLDDALERLKVGRKLPRFATVTADIGYRDILGEALPVLERHGAPLTAYVSPGLASGAVDPWWDVLEALVATAQEVYLTTREGRIPVDCSGPSRKLAAYRLLRDYLTADVAEEQRQPILRDLALLAGVDPKAAGKALMGWDELRRLAAHPLVTIGTHGLNHFNLRRLGDEKAWYEIVDAARIIEMELGVKPRHLAYPYGDPDAFGPREVELAAAAGHASAVTSVESSLWAEHARNLFALPRLRLDGPRQSLRDLHAMLASIEGVEPARAAGSG